MQSNARAAIVLVIGGDTGSGFIVWIEIGVVLPLPGILRKSAHRGCPLENTMIETDDRAVEGARVALIKALLDQQPGETLYHFGTKFGDLELYRLRRAIRAALAAFHAASVIRRRVARQ